MLHPMSVLPSSETFMAQSIRNDTNQDRNTFHNFFGSWLVEQGQNLQQLVSASDEHQRLHQNDSSATKRYEDQGLRPLIERILNHYELYYRAKSRCAKQDVLGILSSSWLTTLEEAFLWIAGWRPSMVFHLLYSKSGLQLEASLAELIRGMNTGDLGDLSPSQLIRVDELQRTTVREERDITEKMAKQQETVADSSMVELSHVVSEMMRSGNASTEGGGLESDRVESTLAPKEEGLEEVLHKADDLRLRTLKEVTDILTPTQTVHFLIAAAELSLSLHEWGKQKDARTHPGGIDQLS